MPKIVINKSWGGFGLSQEALEHLARHRDVPVVDLRTEFSNVPAGARVLFQDAVGLNSPYFDLHRDDPALVETVEVLGEKANDGCSKLKVVEIPDGVAWRVNTGDLLGKEEVHEIGRTWS